MRKLGGKITATLQTKSAVKNSIGEAVESWSTAYKLKGHLDLSSGDSKRTTFNTKLQESTHVFLCDYKPLSGVTAENSRILINGINYDIMLIDNVLELNEHYEILLKKVGN